MVNKRTQIPDVSPLLKAPVVLATRGAGAVSSHSSHTRWLSVWVSLARPLFPPRFGGIKGYLTRLATEKPPPLTASCIICFCIQWRKIYYCSTDFVQSMYLQKQYIYNQFCYGLCCLLRSSTTTWHTANKSLGGKPLLVGKAATTTEPAGILVIP